MWTRPRHVLVTTSIGAILFGAVAYLGPRACSAWDFDTFYYAATALRRGLNPYDASVMTAMAGGIEQFPYLYPASTLWLFVPFTLLSLGAATLAWFGLKLGLAAALMTTWKRTFLRGATWLPLLAVALFGFNGALLMDLRSGNVSILEELLLWLALGHYIEGRRWHFALLIGVASVFKLLPILFLGLLLVPGKERSPRAGPALAGLALFGAVVLLPPMWSMHWVGGLAGSGSVQRPMGEINPCALGMLDTLFYRPESGQGAPALALGLWVAYCVAVLWVSRPALRRGWESREPLQWVVVATTLYTLLSPRMMVYSWILPVVPSLLLVYALFRSGRGRAVVHRPSRNRLAGPPSSRFRREPRIAAPSRAPWLRESAVPDHARPVVGVRCGEAASQP